MNQYLDISDEVKTALAEGKPVVALESTIISHGMPYPKNVKTALEVEAVVREGGAVPATIAIIGGRLKAGLSADEIEHLGKKGLDVTKASRRDLPVLIARKEDGATTVASTMIIAEMAGIRVFCTGGIGGVHREAQNTMDISADLEELAKTEVAVVCAGAKSILDIGLTLEYLETKGVPVLGYGTEELPAFYTKSSGFNVDFRVDAPDEVAMILLAKTKTVGGGTLITVPVPDAYSMAPEYINAKIDAAVAEAEKRGIKGKETTPFLLDYIQKTTGGESLEANIALVKNNAKVSAAIACAYAELSSKGQS
ncbi:MAG: pseudouridine-5'-phosphate glycosidase [Eubacteriales bacterium]